MADTKISEMTEAGPLVASDVIPFLRAGANKKVTLASAPALLGAAQTFTAINKFSSGLWAYGLGGDTGVVIGQGAGLEDVSDNVAIGFGARGGLAINGDTPSGVLNVCVGRHAGSAATGDNAVCIGHAAGQYAYDSGASVRIGYLAGRNTTKRAGYHSSDSVQIGHSAGENATSVFSSVLIGTDAGNSAVSATNAVIIGNSAAFTVSVDADKSVIIGNQAGLSIATADQTVLIGYLAGSAASNCARSVLIGSEAGRSLSRHNTLVIDSSTTYAPGGTSGLIYGEFDNRLLVFNGNVTIAGPNSTGNGKLIVGGTLTAGGLLTNAVQVGTSGPLVYSGSGAPTISAAVKGSLYLRTDGSGAGDRAYIATNTSGGWTALTTAA